MDPLTITAAAGGLAGTVLTLTKTIGAFVATARNSRTELEAVSRELISLQVCLEVLDSDRRHGTLLKDSLEISLNQILVNVQLYCGQIEDLLAKCRSSRLGRPIKWAIQQRDEVNRLRSSLETHKTALQMTHQLNTISILVRETRSRPNTQLETVRDDRVYSEMQRIGQRVDDITRLQDHRPTLQRIEEALAELSESVKNVASKHPSMKSFSIEGCSFAADTVATVSYLDGIPEAETKLQAVIANPFVNPFDDRPVASDEENFVDTQQHPKTAFCPICAESLTEADSNDAQAKTQQLQAYWRSEWLSQLKKELQTFNGQDNGANRVTSCDRSDTILDDAELSDLLSETMSMTSWNDTDSRYAPSSARTVTSSKTSGQFSASSELRQLRSKYEPANRRVKILTEEISAAESELLSLRELHEQDLSRWKTRLTRLQAAPSENIAALQRNNEELKNSLDSAILDISSLTEKNLQLSSFPKVNEELMSCLDLAQGKIVNLEKDNQQLQTFRQENQKLREDLNAASLKASSSKLERSNTPSKDKLQKTLQEKQERSPIATVSIYPICEHNLNILRSAESKMVFDFRCPSIEEFKNLNVNVWIPEYMLPRCRRCRRDTDTWQGWKEFQIRPRQTHRDILGDILETYYPGMSALLQSSPKPSLLFYCYGEELRDFSLDDSSWISLFSEFQQRQRSSSWSYGEWGPFRMILQWSEYGTAVERLLYHSKVVRES